MRNIPSPIAREVEITLPAFVHAVDAKGADQIMTTLDAFEGEHDLLYKCIWYATSHGKAGMILPPEGSLDDSDRKGTHKDQAA